MPKKRKRKQKRSLPNSLEVVLPSHVRRALEEAAKAEDLAMSQVVRRAVKKYLEDGNYLIKGVTS